jgi:peroxiredoxin
VSAKPGAGDGDQPPEPKETGPGAADLLRRLDPDRASASRQASAGAPGSPEPPTAQEVPGVPGAQELPTAPSQQASDEQAVSPEEPAMVPFGDVDLPRSVLPSPVIDTRRYRWMIGIFGLTLVIVVSVYQFLHNGVGTTGIPPGKPLHDFSAALANSNLTGSPNPSPPCTLARHDPRVLNVCLISRSHPLVLSFFDPTSSQCVEQVDALQSLSARFSSSPVRFAAVAVNGSRSTTRTLIRSHHWTIPVAIDSGGVIAKLYDVALCPMAELAYRGGIVKDRLIGDRWQTSASLAPRVQALVASQPPPK